MKKFNFNNQQLKNTVTAISFAFLVTILCVLLTNLLYNEKPLVKKGYVVDMNAQSPDLSASLSSSSSKNSSAKAKVDIKTLIAKANINAGAKIIKKCTACHTLEKGGKNKIGPNLFGIIGRKSATIPGFKYSKAMKAKNITWSYDRLNEFLIKPASYIPGTKMTFAGLKKDKDRANVIAYLEQLGK